MKRISFIIIMVTYTISIQAKTVNSYFEKPLINPTVQLNKLPYGDYIFIRSYEKTTQILISKDHNTLILHTDRNNMKNSTIHSTGYSRLDSTIVKPEKINQWQFNHLIETCLSMGDIRPYSSRKYIGIDEFLRLKKARKIKVNKEDEELVLRYRGNKYLDQDLRVNGYLKSISFKTINDKTGKLNKYYELFIENSYDRNIKKIIIHFLNKLKRN